MRTSIGIALVFLASSAFAQINREAPRFTPMIDGNISPDEMAGQLAIPMIWPIDDGFIAFEGSGSSAEELSATWYVSWDEINLNISAVVLDNTPDFRLTSGGAYNAQDLIQPTFNPFNDPDNFFAPDPGGGPAAIYDMVVNTSDDFGPDIYRHGAQLTGEGYDSITINGVETDTGYVLEASIPWETAMDDVDPNYIPKVGDVHGLSFILISFNGEQGDTPSIATLFITDFGEGVNTIADPTTWNTLTLIQGGGEPALQAGDADRDLDFDQLDLVRVQVAAKYLTASPATWGDGDWDGAPGGTAANPPVGDGLFNQRDIIAALSAGVYLTGPYGVVQSTGSAGDSQTSVVYDPATGQFSVDAPENVELTSINIDSASGIFTGDPAQNLGGSFDNDADANIFKATFGGSFGSLSFGSVAQQGLSETFLLGDLTVVGSLAGGGALGAVDLIYVPEPGTLWLLLVGLCVVIGNGLRVEG